MIGIVFGARRSLEAKARLHLVATQDEIYQGSRSRAQDRVQALLCGRGPLSGVPLRPARPAGAECHRRRQGADRRSARHSRAATAPPQ